MVNVGCGSRLHPAWINLDVYRSAPGVTVHDIRKGLPFADGSVDVCYHSHVLEHLTPAAGRDLIGECYRVLRPGGVLRVVVPDLERIARSYLAALDEASSGSKDAETRYDWFLLELLDQMVRQRSGGEIGPLLREDRFDRDFVRSQVGAEAEQVWASASSATKRTAAEEIARIVKRLSPRNIVAYALRNAGSGTLAGSIREGLFRSTGEVHRWMYDRFSLARLLTRSGFHEVQQRGAAESAIPGFADYELDTDGPRVRKPDSLFVEGVRPDTDLQR
jgi:predicted SAM-dependent methyltransferase